MSATVARRKHSRLHYRLNRWAVEAFSVLLSCYGWSNTFPFRWWV